jgi:hypothetical protein
MTLTDKPNSPGGLTMNSELKEYYESRTPIIEKAIKSLFPDKCTNIWLKDLTGRDERPWDAETLQSTFLDPINQSIQQKKTFYYALGSILLLESSHINPEMYLPLIGINEAFEGCFQLFKDISIHENHNHLTPEELSTDNSIKANVGVALLTLPYYPIVHNYCNLDEDVRLWLFQNTTKSISRVFYANGASQYRKNKRLQFASMKEYQQDSFYLNSPKLKFTFDLWLSLTQQNKSKEIVTNCETITRAFTLSWQLLRDLNSFKLWIEKNKQNQDTVFNSIDNFIVFHIAQSSGGTDILSKKLTLTKLVRLFEESGTEKYIMTCIQENELVLEKTIDQLPFSTDDRIMIKAYIRLMSEDLN